MTMLTNILLIIIGVLLFGFAIFIHELGHFTTAKLFKIKVNEFAIGMGPKLWSKQKGETKYALRLLPIGGYCAMEGEDGESGDKHAFGQKPVWQRMIVIVAGAVMNIIYGFILMIVVTSTQPTFATTQVAAFAENAAMESAGIEIGDRITSIDGYSVYTDRDLSFALVMADPNSVDIVVERNGEKVAYPGVKLHASYNEETKKNTVIFDFSVNGEKRTVFTTLRKAFFDTGSTVRMVFASLKGLVTGQFGMNELAGPVGTAKVIAEAAGQGLLEGFGTAVLNIIMMIVVITVNLGVVNLLPIPALDGGRFLFLLIELIFRKPVPAKYEGWIHTAGFVLVIGLMLIVTFNDVARIFRGG